MEKTVAIHKQTPTTIFQSSTLPTGNHLITTEGVPTAHGFYLVHKNRFIRVVRDAEMPEALNRLYVSEDGARSASLGEKVVITINNGGMFSRLLIRSVEEVRKIEQAQALFAPVQRDTSDATVASLGSGILNEERQKSA